ncbi:MAG: B12-binding domain-containing radical SAM protein [Candidatus Thorarchaeota archaeon]
MSSQRTLLLLNASNLNTALTYPYAFVQISEIAARFGIHTVCKDLYGISEDQWKIYLRKLIQKDSFDMILITLRNSDAVDVNDYIVRSRNTNYHQSVNLMRNQSSFYYPIQATKRLIQVLRRIADVPIVIGGYAFSMMPETLMNYLKPDYGVIGGPDDFFKQFESILAEQKLASIANLVYFQTGSLLKGPREFFPPAPRQEYTEEIITDLKAFNSRFSGENVESSVPLEVSRGCPGNCTMCSEPLVKGKKVQYRDLDVIVEEINFLRKYQLNLLFFICSEINADGTEFLMKLADQLIEINEEREDFEKVYWHALHLLTLTPEELKHIRKAGFCGDFNPLPVVSLDDHNCALNKTPQKSEDIINYFTQAKKVVKGEFRQTGKKFFSLEDRIFSAPQSLNPGDFVKSWNIFLGNIDTTPETLRITLKRADETKLNEIFDSCYVNKATRIYDFMKPTEEVLEHTWVSINGAIKQATYLEYYPSFTYPPALLRHFESGEIIDEFLVLIGDTYLSRKHLFKKDWNWFLASHLEPKTFLSWWVSSIKSKQTFYNLTSIEEVLTFLIFLKKNPYLSNIKLLFNPTPGRKNLLNFAAHMVIQFVLYSQEQELIPVMQYLGLPLSLNTTLNLSPYKFAVRLFKLSSDKRILLDAMKKSPFDTALADFFVEYLIFLYNTPLSPKYQVFFK